MASHDHKILEAGKPGKEKKPPESKADLGEDDACRCKEVSEMSPRRLLTLMLRDLAFWKKAKKE